MRGPLIVSDGQKTAERTGIIARISTEVSAILGKAIAGGIEELSIRVLRVF